MAKLLFPFVILTKGSCLCLMYCIGDFGVNKEAQGKVSIAMDDFVKNGGGLLM